MEKESRDTLLYFAKDRGHANVAGNDRIAGWVYDFLVEQELVGGTG
jgi:lysophospholipase L1-like esterase